MVLYGVVMSFLDLPLLLRNFPLSFDPSTWLRIRTNGKENKNNDPSRASGRTEKKETFFKKIRLFFSMLFSQEENVQNGNEETNKPFALRLSKGRFVKLMGVLLISL